MEFVETARTGSFTAAAVILGMTNSAVGKSVSRLEARLGVKLLHRTTRRLTLTIEGAAYLENCTNIVDQLESVENALATGKDSPSGQLRLDLPGAFGRQNILPILTSLANQHPRLDFSVIFSERKADIITESVDLAVRIGALDNHTEFSARKLGTQRLVVCASPDYLRRTGVPLSPDDLVSRDCIAGWRSSGHPLWLFKSPDDNSSYAIEIQARHQFSDGGAMVRAVLDGCGLCQLPTWLVGEYLTSGELVTVLDQYAGAEMPIHAIWPRSRYLQPKLRVLIDALVEAGRSQPAFNP
ncbi:MAG: LysR family transcriptional regulator [Gluconobacter sp.]|uniref:LysR family transcriptional regulator n=1 Tax=Gluconobacter sp. TaxID=1876758 RepID=UPI0039E9EBB2